MKYVALLRGINVGGNHIVEMKRLKAMFESLGFTNVSTYINSGNVFFEGTGKTTDIASILEQNFKSEFGFDIPTLVKTRNEISEIIKEIPDYWTNDSAYRTDVAFLFPNIDSEKIITELPINRKYIDIRYTRGAIYWNVKRENVFKSQLVKLIGHQLYKSMTIRNINTVRYLEKLKEIEPA